MPWAADVQVSCAPSVDWSSQACTQLHAPGLALGNSLAINAATRLRSSFIPTACSTVNLSSFQTERFERKQPGKSTGTRKEAHKIWSESDKFQVSCTSQVLSAACRHADRPAAAIPHAPHHSTGVDRAMMYVTFTTTRRNSSFYK
jgi:hypothetical protein